jgi:glycerophosphoryl diester phosphodiesterase
MKLDWPTPLIFAHRGASALAPENTFSAFDLAVKHEADVIELDVKLSADGHVVVIHDQTIDRTTNASGNVGDFSLAELQKLDAGSHYDPNFSGEQIPSLAEVLEFYSEQIFLNIELTNYANPFDTLPDKVAQLLWGFRDSNRILVSSFHPIPLRRFHKLLPNVPLGFLARRGLSGLISRSWFGEAIVPYQVLHPEKNDVSPGLVKRMHKSAKRVHTYTVNSGERMKWLLSLGVDGIITDNPLIARQVLYDGRSTL